MFPISNLATVTNGGRDLGSVNWKIRSPNLVDLLSPLSLLKSGLVCITDGHKNGLWLGVERFLACKDATKNYFHHQLICWLISWLNDTQQEIWFVKWQKKKKKSNFWKPNVTNLTSLFCPTNSLKPKDILITIPQDKEKQQTLTRERLEQGIARHCSLKNDLTG